MLVSVRDVIKSLQQPIVLLEHREKPAAVAPASSTDRVDADPLRPFAIRGAFAKQPQEPDKFVRRTPKMNRDLIRAEAMVHAWIVGAGGRLVQERLPHRFGLVEASVGVNEPIYQMNGFETEIPKGRVRWERNEFPHVHLSQGFSVRSTIRSIYTAWPKAC